MIFDDDIDPNHPLLIDFGHTINTASINRIANTIVFDLEQGFHGCDIYADSGVGKTTAQEYLVSQADRWLQDKKSKRKIGVAKGIVFPASIIRTPLGFWTMMAEQFGFTIASQPKLHDLYKKVHNKIRSDCVSANVRKFVLFIDGAEHITANELQYLQDLDNSVSKDQLTLFIAFFNQSDHQGIQIGDKWQDHASQVVRRWFLDSTYFLPLMDVNELAGALRRYDTSACWPTSDMPFSRYFAKEAFDREGGTGWRLEYEAEELWKGMEAIRNEAGLPAGGGWPMSSFIMVIRYLLVQVTFDRKDFSGFTKEDIRNAFIESGYLRVEFVRGRSKITPAGYALIDRIVTPEKERDLDAS